MREPNPEKWLSAVGPGWNGLVLAAISLLPEGSTVVQVKEKFGALRFYFVFPKGFSDQRAVEKVNTGVSAIEIASKFICENCGMRGELRTDSGWLLTLCDKCHARKNE